MSLSLLPRAVHAPKHTANKKKRKEKKRNEPSQVNARVFGVPGAQEIRSLTLDAVYSLRERPENLIPEGEMDGLSTSLDR